MTTLLLEPLYKRSIYKCIIWNTNTKKVSYKIAAALTMMQKATCTKNISSFVALGIVRSHVKVVIDDEYLT